MRFGCSVDTQPEPTAEHENDGTGLRQLQFLARIGLRQRPRELRHQRHTGRDLRRGRKLRTDTAEARFVRDAVTIDAALLPEIVHAEVRHDADQRRTRLASLLQIRRHGGGNHLRADDHVRCEAADRRLQSPDQAQPAPLHHDEPRAHAVALRDCWRRRAARSTAARTASCRMPYLPARGAWTPTSAAICEISSRTSSTAGGGPGFAFQDLAPGMFVQRIEALVQLRIVLDEAEVGRVHGLRDTGVHQRPQVQLSARSRSRAAPLRLPVPHARGRGPSPDVSSRMRQRLASSPSQSRSVRLRSSCRAGPCNRDRSKRMGVRFQFGGLRP